MVVLLLMSKLTKMMDTRTEGESGHGFRTNVRKDRVFYTASGLAFMLLPYLRAWSLVETCSVLSLGILVRNSHLILSRPHTPHTFRFGSICTVTAPQPIVSFLPEMLVVLSLFRAYHRRIISFISAISPQNLVRFSFDCSRFVARSAFPKREEPLVFPKVWESRKSLTS